MIEKGAVMDRRQAIKLVGGAAAGSFVLREAQAKTARPSPIIDGNLVAPIDPAAPLDAATAALVRSSGLTAFKQTLGGSGNQNRAETDTEIADLAKGIALNPTLFIQIRSAADFDDARRDGRIGVIFSFEAAEMLEGRLENIEHFRAASVLVMGLSYNNATPFASGTLARNPTGLTDLGRQAIQRMNALGVTVDVSHSDEPSSMAALSASAKPILITHAGCAAVHPNPRNKSDMLLRVLAEKGGVIGIYELSFLRQPRTQPTLDDYMTHVVHAINICGEEHVGIGTDGMLTPFDTSPRSMKAWYAEIERRKAAGVGAPGEGPPPFVVGLNRSDRYRFIDGALRARGYRSRTIDKVLGTNFERVFRETWRAA